MGYTTDFEGEFTITPTLKPEHRVYLLAFSESRRMKRDESKTAKRPDPVREAVGLPVGKEGQYYVGEEGPMGQGDKGGDIIDYNREPLGQPGLWCKWEPNDEGTTIRWSGAEKFYDYVKWLQYLIDNFLGPWGYKLAGTVEYQGEDPGDFGRITVNEDHQFEEATSRVVTAAKAEVESFTSNVLRSAGIEALANGHLPPLLAAPAEEEGEE